MLDSLRWFIKCGWGNSQPSSLRLSKQHLDCSILSLVGTDRWVWLWAWFCATSASPLQQDCQEFLVLLLDCLHEDIINQSSLESAGEESEKEGGSRDYQMKETHSVITDTFQGQLRNEVKQSVHWLVYLSLSFSFLPPSLSLSLSLKVACSVCGHVSVKCDPFVYLSVPIPHSNEKQISKEAKFTTSPPLFPLLSPSPSIAVFWSSVTDNTRTVEKSVIDNNKIIVPLFISLGYW